MSTDIVFTGTYMYKSLGTQWATTILGFIALALMPVPLLFFIFGARIRKMSRFVPKLPLGAPGSAGVVVDHPPVKRPAAVLVPEKV